MTILTQLGTQFGKLITNLVKGNAKKASLLAEKCATDATAAGKAVAFQTLIEDMAQEQALINGGVNLPSLFPGIGTLISFWLLGAENLLILDRSVTLILTLRQLHGHVSQHEAALDFVLGVIGEAYDLIDETCEKTAQSITQRYVSRELPQQYLNVGLNRILTRVFPYRSGLRLLPIIGVAASAISGYETIVKVGRITLRHLQHLE